MSIINDYQTGCQKWKANLRQVMWADGIEMQMILGNSSLVFP